MNAAVHKAYCIAVVVLDVQCGRHITSALSRIGPSHLDRDNAFPLHIPDHLPEKGKIFGGSEVLILLLVLKIGNGKACAVLQLRNFKVRLFTQTRKERVQCLELFFMLLELLLLRPREEVDPGELDVRELLPVPDQSADRVLIHAELASVCETGIYAERLVMRVSPIGKHLQLKRGFRCIASGILSVLQDLHEILTDLENAGNIELLRGDREISADPELAHGAHLDAFHLLGHLQRQERIRLHGIGQFDLPFKCVAKALHALADAVEIK